MIFSPKTALLTGSIAHTTPLYKGAGANKQHMRAVNRGFKVLA